MPAYVVEAWSFTCDSSSSRTSKQEPWVLRLVVDNPDLLFEEYKDKGVFHAGTQLMDTPWRTREFAFWDLNHNASRSCGISEFPAPAATLVVVTGPE